MTLNDATNTSNISSETEYAEAQPIEYEAALDLARTVTVLRAAPYSSGKVARGCKIYRGLADNQVVDFGSEHASHYSLKLQATPTASDAFNLIRYLVDGVSPDGSVITKEMRQQLLVVSGTPKPLALGKVDGGYVHEGIRAAFNDKDGEPGAIRPPEDDLPKHVQFIDVDKLAIPAGLDIVDDWDVVKRWLHSSLGPHIGDSSIGIYPTGSCGIARAKQGSGKVIGPRNEINCRVVLYLNTAMTCSQFGHYVLGELTKWCLANVSEWAGRSNLFDASIYQPQQKIFTAPGVYQGMLDPYEHMERFSVLLGRTEALGLPADCYEIIEHEAVESPTQRVTKTRGKGPRASSGSGVRGRFSGLTIDATLDLIQPGDVDAPSLSATWKMALAGWSEDQARDALSEHYLRISTDADDYEARCAEKLSAVKFGRWWHEAQRARRERKSENSESSDQSAGHDDLPVSQGRSSRDKFKQHVLATDKITTLPHKTADEASAQLTDLFVRCNRAAAEHNVRLDRYRRDYRGWKARSEEVGFIAAHDPEPEAPEASHAVALATPGVGKTEARIQAIDPTRLSDTLTLWLVPDHGLGEETAERMREWLIDAGHPMLVDRIRHHKGRGQAGMCVDRDEGAGTYDKLAKATEKMGQSPRYFCKEFCPIGKAGKCNWLNQADDRGPGIIVAAQQSAMTGWASTTVNSEHCPDRIVSDELPMNSLLSNKISISLVALAYDKKLDRVRRGEQKLNNALKAEVELEAWRKRLTSALGAVAVGEMPVSAVEHLFASIDRAMKLEERLRYSLLKETHKLTATIQKTQSEQMDGHLEALRARYTVSLQATQLWELINVAKEFEGRRRNVHNMRVRLDTDGHQVVDTYPRSLWPAFMKHVPTEWLDGTGVASIWKEITRTEDGPVDLYIEEAKAKSSGYVGTQFADQGYVNSAVQRRKDLSSDKKLRVDSNASLVFNKIRQKAAEHETVLVVAQKKTIEYLRPWLPKNVKTLHFGKLRGQDAFGHHDAIVVVGRESPGVRDLELQAESLHLHDQAVGDLALVKDDDNGRPQWPFNWRDLPAADGSLLKVWTEKHADETVDALWQQRTAAELNQALHRVRLTRREDRVALGEAKQCDVTVFSNVPTGVPMHRVGGFDDAITDAADVMLAGGIVFKSAKAIECAHAQLIPSAVKKNGNVRTEAAAAAKAAWQRSLVVAGAIQVTPLSLYNNISNNGVTHLEDTTKDMPLPLTGWSLVKFKLAGDAQGQQALVERGRHPDIKQALSKALGSDVTVLDVVPVKSSGESVQVEWTSWQAQEGQKPKPPLDFRGDAPYPRPKLDFSADVAYCGASE